MRSYFFSLLLLCSCAVTIAPMEDWSDPLGNPPRPIRGHQEPTQSDAGQIAQDKWCPSGAGQVRVVNPKPVVATDTKAKAWRQLYGRPQSFGYGDSCLSEPKGWWQALGPASEARVLVQYWGPAERGQYFACVNRTLFFMDAEELRKHCEASAPESPQVATSEPSATTPKPLEPTTATPSGLTEQEREKEIVKELLEQHGR